MIRPIKITLNAAHPEVPLIEATTFVGSPSAVFVSGVPATVGLWRITAVKVVAHCPDDSATTVECVKGASGVWTATLPATATSGRVANGLQIIADGIDERGEPVTGYVLGMADFAVFTRDMTIESGGTVWYVHYFDEPPANPVKGDLAPTPLGGLQIYNGTAWMPVALPSVTSVNGQTGVVQLDASNVGALPKTDVIAPSASVDDTGMAADAHYTYLELIKKYEKPSSGIPKSDLSSAVQTSLEKADNALPSSAAADFAPASLSSEVSGIEAKIPGQATAQNQLADKAFVADSVATNSATFRGSYNAYSELGVAPPYPLTPQGKTAIATAIAAKLASLVPPVVPENNDYCFVQVPRNTQDPADFDPTIIERVDRYKCTVTESGGVTTRAWGYEWSLNNSSFTQAQWAAINSGITSALVTKLGALPTADELAASLLAKYEKPAGGIPKSDLASGVQASLDKADTALQGAMLGETTVPISVMGRILEIPMSEPIPNASYVGAADAYHTWLQIQQRAMKATNPTADNLAALDANGNPIDSGIAKTSIAPLASPAFTGTPTAPDIGENAPDGQIANKKYVDEHSGQTDIGLSVVDGLINVTFEE